MPIWVLIVGVVIGVVVGVLLACWAFDAAMTEVFKRLW